VLEEMIHSSRAFSTYLTDHPATSANDEVASESVDIPATLRRILID
jgi:hypothetical protein